MAGELAEQTYYLDAKHALAAQAWRKFEEALSVPGDTVRDVRLDPMPGEDNRTRVRVTVDRDRDRGAADDLIRRFRAFLDNL